MNAHSRHHPAFINDWPHKSRELAQLLACTGVGDRAAFAGWHERTSGHLCAVLLRIQRDRALAEHLLQEVYGSVWKAAVGVDAARSQPLTWLTHIARHRAIDSLRRSQNQPCTKSLHADGDGDGDDSGALLERLASDTPGLLDLLGQASDAHELSHCMDRLSPPQRQRKALTFFDGLSHAEAAARLQEPLGPVKSWVRRVLVTLKACLERSAWHDSGGAI